MRYRYTIVAIILLVATFTINFLNYDWASQSEAGISAIKNIPETIDEWTGSDIHLDPAVYNILETKSIIHRNYIFGQNGVFLSIVYYPDTKVDLHAPEACLGARGERIEKSPRILKMNVNGRPIELEVNQLIANIGNSSDLVFYFYKAGSYIGKSYILLRLNIAKNKLVSFNKSGALIRVSTRIESKNQELAAERLKRFIEIIMPYLVNFL